MEPSIEAQDPTDLLFIHCNDNRGRPSNRDRSRIKRHVVRIRPGSNANGAPDGTDTGLDLASRQAEIVPVVIRFRATGHPERTKRDRQRQPSNSMSPASVILSDPQAPVGGSAGAIDVPCSLSTDITNVVQWFLYRNDRPEMDAKYGASATYWLDAYWVWSRSNEL